MFFETHSFKLWSPAYLTSFGVHAFHVDSVKPLPSPWSWRLPLCFLLKSFIILAFIFRSLIHSSSHHADCEIWVPLPGFGPGPWQWKGQVLTTGPPRNSLIFDFLMCIYTQNFLVYLYKMEKKKGGASLAVLWLRLLASTAGDVGSVPGGRTRSHTLCSVAKKKKQQHKTQ